MTDQIIPNEKIADLFFKKVTDGAISTDEQAILDKWLSVSVYNRSVWEDVSNDKKLQSDLIQAYHQNRSQCWSIILQHRTSLHNGMGFRSGNFWQRGLRLVKRILGFEKLSS